EQIVLRAQRSRILSPPLDATVTMDDACQDLGAAEVDADDVLSVQGAWLPYSLDGDGREALSRLSRRAHERPRSARAAAGAPRSKRPKRPRPGTATRAAPASTLELEAPHRHRPHRRSAADRHLVDRRLPVVP